MPLPVAAHVMTWTVLATGIGVCFVRQNEVSDKLARIGADSTAPNSDSAPGPASGSAELGGSKEFAALTRRLAVAETENKALRADHDKLVATILASDGPAGVAAEASSSKFVEKPGFEESVRAVLDRYALETKFRDTLKKAAGPLIPKKPKFEQLVKVLALTEAQGNRMDADVRTAQTELFQLLQIPRADGSVPLEEIAQADQYPEGSPKKTEIFLKLFKMKIPDSEETYMEHAVSLVQRIKDSTRTYLDEGQRNTLDGIDLDWFGIQLPPQ